MIKKYEIHDQITGVLEGAQTFEEALVIQRRIQEDYLKTIAELFVITVLVQNADGSWTQSIADENGDPLIPVPPVEEPEEEASE
jgi:hypothetical protein